MMRQMIAATGNAEKMVEIRQILAGSGIELETMKDAGLELEIVENGSTFEENALIKARAVAQASGKMAIADDSGLVVDAMGGEPGIHSARWMGHDTSYEIKNREIIRLVDAYCAKKETESAYIQPENAAGGTRMPLQQDHAAGGTGMPLQQDHAAGGTGMPLQQDHTAGGTCEAAVHPGCLWDKTPGPLRSARFVCAVAVVWPDGRERTATGVLEGRIHTKQCGKNGFGYDPIFYLPEYGMTSGQIPREEKNRISHRGQAFRKIRKILEEEA